MTDHVFRPVTADFAVSGQIDAADLERAKALGFSHVIDNRPDDELAHGEAGSAALGRAAQALGLGFTYAPIVPGSLTPDHLAAVDAAACEPGARVLAYCRSGARSIAAWALAQARSGAMEPGAILRLAAETGYDLTPLTQALNDLAKSAIEPR